jgi:hypothetical protein
MNPWPAVLKTQRPSFDLYSHNSPKFKEHQSKFYHHQPPLRIHHLSTSVGQFCHHQRRNQQVRVRYIEHFTHSSQISKTQLWHVTAILKNQKIQSNNLLRTSNSLPVLCKNAMVVWKFSNTQNWRLIYSENLQKHETGGSLILKIFKNSESKVITISKKHPTLVHTHNRKPDFNRFYEDNWVKSRI